MGGLIALITNVTPTRTTTTINSKFRAMMPRYSIPNQRDSDPTVASPPRLNQRRRHHELRGRSESNSAELSCSLESGPARLSRWAILSIVKLEIEFMDLSFLYSAVINQQNICDGNML